MVARTIAAAAFAFLCTIVSAGALELTFRATTGGEATTYAETLKSVPGGFHATVTSASEQSTMEMDSALQTRSWVFRAPREKTEIEALLSGTTISIHGTVKGSPFAAAFDTDGLPWCEYQELSLEGFGSGTAPSMGFVTINRSTMKLVKLKVLRKGPVDILVQGMTVPAVEAVLLIEGVPEFLLRSRLWLRRSDGRYLRLVVPPLGGIGSSTLIELVGEDGSL